MGATRRTFLSCVEGFGSGTVPPFGPVPLLLRTPPPDHGIRSHRLRGGAVLRPHEQGSEAADDDARRSGHLRGGTAAARLAEMKKTFVLDTNVLLHDPQAIFKFDDNDGVIPITVIEEVDRFKKDMSEI